MTPTILEAAGYTMETWPNCIVPDCPGKACLWLDGVRCWPHNVGLPLDWMDGIAPGDEAAREARLVELGIPREFWQP